MTVVGKELYFCTQWKRNMETNEVMIDIGKPEDEVQSQKDAQAARFGKIINYLSVFSDDLTIINRSRSNL